MTEGGVVIVGGGVSVCYQKPGACKQQSVCACVRACWVLGAWAAPMLAVQLQAKEKAPLYYCYCYMVQAEAMNTP